MSKIIKEPKILLFKNILRTGSLSFYIGVIVLIIIPLYIWFVPPFMILWGIIWIIENQMNKTRFKDYQFQRWLFILFVAFFLWQLVSILYSADVKTGWNTIISRLSLILFPLVLFYPGQKIEKNIGVLLKIFAFSTSIFIIICFGNALFNSISYQNGIFMFNSHPKTEYWMNYFYGSYFSINQHPSYLAMYSILSGFISFESGSDNSLKMWKRAGWLINGIFLLASLYFLSSRSGLLSILILLPVYLFYKFYKIKKLLTIISSLLLLVVSIYIISTNERVKIGISQVSNETFLSKDGRISIWSAAFHSIRHNFIFGVGVGDVKSELMKEYLRQDDKTLIQNNYNVHNQYLEILMENGIIGLTLFLSILVIMLYFAFSEGNILYLLFIIMMLVFFLFETILERLQGISFFSLFSFLLIYSRSVTESAAIDCKLSNQ